MSKPKRFIVVSPAGATDVSEDVFDAYMTREERLPQLEAEVLSLLKWRRGGAVLDQVKNPKTRILVEFLCSQPERHVTLFLSGVGVHAELLRQFLSPDFFNDSVSASDYSRWLHLGDPLV